MEVCKNKISGKYFVYIRDTGANEALLVTPDAQIKSLHIDLFDDIEDYEEHYILERNILTGEQIKRFNEFNKKRSEDIKENFHDYFDQMSRSEQDLLIQKLQGIMEKNKE